MKVAVVSDLLVVAALPPHHAVAIEMTAEMTNTAEAVLVGTTGTGTIVAVPGAQTTATDAI